MRMPRARFLPIVTVLLISTLIHARSEAASLPMRDEMIPHDVALRLLCRCDGTRDARILVGRLPERLPVEVPMPDKAKVIASVVKSSTDVEIVLDAPQSNAQVQSFYKEKLKAAGWKSQGLATIDILLRGFIPTEDSRDLPLAFCKSTKGPSLSINVETVDNAPTDIHLRLNADPKNSLCESLGESELGLSKENLENLKASRGPLPALQPPADTKVSNMETNGIDSVRATIDTKLSIQSLANHYESQFKRDGWTRLSSQQIDKTRSSIWYLKDKNGRSWQGILNLTETEGTQNQYAGSVMILLL